MSQPKDNSTYPKQQQGKNTRAAGRTNRGQQQHPKKPSNNNNYVPKAATTTTTTNGSGAPLAPRPTQGAPFANGGPRVNPAMAVPQRTQSAPPNLREQQQAPIFIPNKTNAPAPSAQQPVAQSSGDQPQQQQQAHPHPLSQQHVQVPHQAQSATQHAHAHVPSTQHPGQTPAQPGPVPQTVPQSGGQPTQQAPIPTQSQSHPQGQSSAPVPAQNAPPQTGQPPLSQPFHGQPGQPPQYKYPYPYYPQSYGMVMQQPPQGRPIFIQPPRHAGPVPHPGAVPHNPAHAQPGPMGPPGPSGMHVSQIGSMPRPMVQNYQPRYPVPPPQGSFTRQPVPHPSVIPAQPPAPRQTRRIAIIDPATMQEVTHSPQKDNSTPKTTEASSPPAPDFQTPPPSRAITIQAPPASSRTSSPSTKHDESKDLDKTEEQEKKEREEKEQKAKEEKDAKEKDAKEKEQAKLAEELRLKEENERKQEEERLRLEEEKRKKEEEAKLKKEEDEKREAEAKAQEERKQEQAKLEAEEAKKREEDLRAEAAKQKEEEQKLAVERADLEKRSRDEAEAKLAEESKQAEEDRKKKEEDDTRKKETELKKKDNDPSRPSRKSEKDKKAPKRTPVIERKKVGLGESSGKLPNKQPPKRKDVLKKADAGDFSAAHFDAYSSKKSEAKEESEPLKEDVAPEEAISVVAPTPSVESQPTEEPEDDWEAKADDWEAKADQDVPLQSKEVLRPAFGGPSGFAASAEGLLADPTWNQTPGGKKMYDRDFLLKFQPYCKERPNGLPPIEVILGYDDKKSSGPGGSMGPLGGSAGKPGKSPTGPQWRGPSSPFMGRGGRGNPTNMVANRFGAPPGLPMRGGMPSRGVPMGPIRGGSGRHQQVRPGKKGGKEELPFPESTEPAAGSWIPPSRRASAEPNAVIYRQLQDTLNKLTDKKFEVLSKELLDTLTPHASDPDIIKQLITIIFECALSQPPQFSITYARLCHFIDRNLPTPAAKEGQPKQTFKRFLLNRCQQEFEQKDPKVEDKEQADKDKPAVATDADDKDDAPDAQNKKKRMIGNIVFIGELYKENMLNDRIIHNCVFCRLLREQKHPVEEDLEACCKLLTTIGKVLDVPKAKRIMDAYFNLLQRHSANKQLPKRLRFLITDVMDLRKRNWKELQPNGAVPAGNNNAQRPSVYNPRGPVPSRATGPLRSTPTASPASTQRQAVAPGGWETVPARRGSEVTSPRGGQVVLGPNSQMGLMGSGGAKGWRPENDKSGQPQGRRNTNELVPPQRGNMFNALSGSGQEPRKVSPRGGAPVEAAPYKSYDEEDEDEDDFNDEGGQDKTASDDSAEDLEAKGADILADFEESRDPDEAIQALQDLDAPRFHSEFVRMLFKKALEVREDERSQYMNLLKAVGAVISTDAFSNGFRRIAENFDTFVEDFPRAPQLFGLFIGHAIIEDVLPPKALNTLLGILKSAAYTEKVLGSALNSIATTSESASRAQQVARHADIKDPAKYLLPKNQSPEGFATWLKAYDLQDVFGKAPQQRPSKALDLTELEKLVSRGEPEALQAWIETNTTAEQRADINFGGQVCRALFAVISATGSDETAKLQEATQFRKFSPVLTRLLSNNQRAQVACLFEVQRFCAERDFPNGLVCRLFSHLNNGVISDAAFHAWHDEDRPDVPGKERTVSEVSSWLSWLRTQRPTSSSTD